MVYDELRRLARHYMGNERVGHTLQATALVNEAYLKLIDIHKVRLQNRAHFFAMSARLMRRILVDSARARKYQKRGAGAQKVTLDEGLLVADPSSDLVARPCSAARQLSLEMRFFGGLTVEEAAEALSVSVDTEMRDWKLAKAWLQRELKRVVR